MTKKIAIMGTHGTGKSTLAYELCSRLKRYKFSVKHFEEHAGECPFEINGKDFDAQRWIIGQQYISELEAKLEKGRRRNRDFYVFDRSIFDGYVYSLDMVKKGSIEELDKWMLPMIMVQMKTYDFLFVTQIYCGGLDEDGTRSIDPIWQRDIDQLFKQELKKYKIKYYDLPLEFDAERKLTEEEISKLHAQQANYMLEVILNAEGKSNASK